MGSETARVHHAARRGGGGVATRGARTAAGDAGDRRHVPSLAATAARNLAALRTGLHDLGYIEGRNIKIASRFADGMAERFPALVVDLVALKPAAILVGSTSAILAARKVTRTIPLIWFGSVDDPVALGLVESFARPGGNVTGFLLSSDARMVTKNSSYSWTPRPGSREWASCSLPTTPPLMGQ